MFNAKRLLDQFLGAQSVPGRLPSAMGAGVAGTAQSYGGLAQGAMVAGVLGLLLGTRTGRRIGAGALKLGGLAAVTALAYKAYQSWQAGAAPQTSLSDQDLAPPPADSAFAPGNESTAQETSVTLLRAMISAAKADGHIDSAERAAIFGELEKLGLDAQDQQWIEREMTAPLDIDGLAAAAQTPELATAIYTASLMAITTDTAAERGYLALLAARLDLAPELVAHLDATVKAVSA